LIQNNLSFDLHNNSFQFDSNRFFISSYLTFLFLQSTKSNVNSHFLSIDVVSSFIPVKNGNSFYKVNVRSQQFPLNNSHFAKSFLFSVALFIDWLWMLLLIFQRKWRKIEKSMWFHAISPLNLFFFQAKRKPWGESEKKSHAKISSSFSVTLCFVASSFCIVINKVFPSIFWLILLQSQDED